ncbi:MAG: hypothetical protein V4639_04580 [Pseudomonadota bacterium]
MADSTQDRMKIGRRALTAAPNMAARAQAFHAWMIKAADTVQPKHVTTVVEGDRVVALLTPVGRFELAEELSRVGDELFTRVVFFRAATALRETPEEIYTVRVLADGAAHFGSTEIDHFELDDYQDDWLPRNMIRLAYELAWAATAERSPAGKMGA